MKISSPIAPVAVAIAVLATAIGTPVGGASANECVGAPKTASPQGQHWYYRIDRSKGRKCWYLRSFLWRSHEAAKPEAHLAATQSTMARPAPSSPPSADTARPVGHGNSALHQPVKILAVRTVRFANPATIQAPQQRSQQQTAAPAVASGNENGNPNTAKPTAAGKPTAHAPDPLLRNAASRPRVAPQTMGPERVGTLAPMFFLLVLGIGLATLVFGVAIKTAGRQRAVSILEDPDSAWRRYRFGERRPGLKVSNALASPARAQLPVARSKITASSSASLSVPGLKELEPALRALGEARQHAAA